MSTQYLKSAPGKASAAAANDKVRQTVTEVIADIRQRGDAAVREDSERFDNWSPESFALGAEQIEKIIATVPEQVITDIKAVQDRVRNFARHQLASLHDFEVESEPGVFLGQKNLLVSRAGAYVPGGRYPWSHRPTRPSPRRRSPGSRTSPPAPRPSGERSPRRR